MGNEELAAVCTRACVGHREEPGTIVPEARGKLVGELVAWTTHAGAGWITTLNHEARDHAMEGNAVVEAATGEIQEVGDGDRGLAGVERGMNISLGSVENDADVLGGLGRVSGSGDTGGHGESCGKGEKCLFHRSTIR